MLMPILSKTTFRKKASTFKTVLLKEGWTTPDELAVLSNISADATPTWADRATVRQCPWVVRAAFTMERSSMSCFTPWASTMSTVGPTGTSTSGFCCRMSLKVGCSDEEAEKTDFWPLLTESCHCFNSKTVLRATIYLPPSHTLCPCPHCTWTESFKRFGRYIAKAISKLASQEWPRMCSQNFPILTCQLESCEC